MENMKKDTDQAYIFELNDDMRQRLQPLAKNWYHWIRPTIATSRDPSLVALQLAAYQLVAQKYIDSDEIERQD